MWYAREISILLICSQKRKGKRKLIKTDPVFDLNSNSPHVLFTGKRQRLQRTRVPIYNHVLPEILFRRWGLTMTLEHIHAHVYYYYSFNPSLKKGDIWTFDTGMRIADSVKCWILMHFYFIIEILIGLSLCRCFNSNWDF